MTLYRAFPYDASAADHDEGGALYVPPPSIAGRIANVGLYRELYFAEQPEAAVAEHFGFLSAWYPSDFVHASGRPYALSAYELDGSARVFDLNDSAALVRIGIAQSSRVVTRDRSISQTWARAIYESGDYGGVSWWSYYCPDWTAYGLWDLGSLRHVGPVEVLTTAHPAVIVAARTIVRQIVRDAPVRRRRR